MNRRHLFAALLPLVFAALPARSQTVYSNDFDTPAVVAGGVSANFSGGTSGGLDLTLSPYDASYGNIYRNNSNTEATTLTLTGLGAHSAVDVGFVLAFLDSWDSTNGSPAPDFLDLSIDGSLVASYTFNNAGGNVIAIGGGTVLYSYVQFDSNVFYSDSVVDMRADPGLVFAHSAPTLTVSFIASGAGWQGGSDEAYGIDNLTVSLVPVPEPDTWALWLGGVAALAPVLRRRRA